MCWIENLNLGLVVFSRLSTYWFPAETTLKYWQVHSMVGVQLFTSGQHVLFLNERLMLLAQNQNSVGLRISINWDVYDLFMKKNHILTNKWLSFTELQYFITKLMNKIFVLTLFWIFYYLCCSWKDLTHLPNLKASLFY